jgi:hypothetical protein
MYLNAVLTVGSSVLDRKELGTPPRNDAFGRDSLRDLGRSLAIDEAVKQCRCLVRHSFECVSQYPA